MLEETVQAGQPAEHSPGAARPKILVIGLGNPILGDDGIGWHVVQAIQARLQTENDAPDEKHSLQKLLASITEGSLEFDCLSLGGLALMERLVGYTHALIIDAINTQNYPAGEVCNFHLQDLPRLAMGHLASAHDTSLQNALKMGRMMGAELPIEILIVGIEAQAVYDFSEQLSDPVAAAIPKASQLVLVQLLEWLQPPN
ncbi:MAG TPA: hydrogenase maturation protease [Anaerolineales bacterium]|nr:hydrogenase maturation protease [Anaerolineales bacterium]